MAVETAPPQFDPSVSRLLRDIEAARATGCDALSLTGGAGVDVLQRLAIAVVAHQHCLDRIAELLDDRYVRQVLSRPATRRNARGQRRPTAYKSAGKGKGTKRPRAATTPPTRADPLV
jgi:hypothetical protein